MRPTAFAGAADLLLHQQTLSLLPERAVYWHEQQCLIVADVHLGKAQVFQRAGIPISNQSFHHDLERLHQLALQCQAKQLIILGDFVHHASGLTPKVRMAIASWCKQFPAKIFLITGNHDKPNLPFLNSLCIEKTGLLYKAPFAFAHEYASQHHHFLFSGHIHPVISMQPNLRLPVFAFYPNHGILPAFSYFTGGVAPARLGLKLLFVVAQDDGVVMQLPVKSGY